MDDILSRQLPHSLEAEQAVLGSLLMNPASVPVAIEALNSDDFFLPLNKQIFETIHSMFTNSQAIDAVTLLDKINFGDYAENDANRLYILQIMEITPSSANVNEYIQIIRDKSMLRSIIDAMSEITHLAFSSQDSASDISEMAEQKVYAIRHGREIKGLTHIKKIISELYETLDELAQNESSIPGIETGFTALDTFITGLNKSDLVLVAARPGMGKTSFALNLALNAAKKSDKSIVVFQLEMSKSQLASRFLANEALVDSRKLKTGDLDDDDWGKIARASSVLAKSKIYIDDNPSITVAEIKAKCRRMGEDLGLIVIDYLQLMHSGKRSDNRVTEVSEISRSLKIMAKELNVPVVCLSQLSRASELRADKRPMLSDLRESGAIEQDADIVIFLYRDDYYNPETEEKNVAEVIISKNRHGSVGTIKLQWIGEYTIFSNQDTIHS
ncbi:MAG: replicative DNA helicase [Clostridia bacterium]